MTGRPPHNVNVLRGRVDTAAKARGVAPGRLMYTVGATVALQMTPAGVAKGGGAIRQRLTETQARLTRDLDFARPGTMSLDDFADAYADLLQAGWHGFTGRLVTRDKAKPEGVPTKYVMDPFDVKVAYNGKPFCTILLEVGFNEVGSGDAVVERLGGDIAGIFEEIGLPAPSPVRVMSAEHQIAQKLHACTGTDAAGRAHDLVDIQLLAAVEDLDHAEIARIAGQLFPFRKQHQWPPTLVVHDQWPGLYTEAIKDLTHDGVAASVDEAAGIVAALIDQCCAAAAGS